MKEIEEIKKRLADMTPGEQLGLIAVMFLIVGATVGVMWGEYQTAAKITQELENHAIDYGTKVPEYGYFTIDGEYIYYLVKMNLTIEEYQNSIMKGDRT